MADRIVESDGFRILSRLDDLLESFECTAADKEDIRRINLNKLLMRTLSSALRRNGSYSSLQDFQQCLLYTLAGNISCDRSVFRFSCDFIDLIDVDDSVLSALDIIVCCLNEAEQNVFYVLADIPASVSAVASAIANGTLISLASVCARYVFPEPVGPSIRMLLFCSSMSEDAPESTRL